MLCEGLASYNIRNKDQLLHRLSIGVHNLRYNVLLSQIETALSYHVRHLWTIPIL
jgi:hypothetical protein